MKEEDPKTSYQLYKLRLNPHDQLGRLSLRAPTKENTLVLIAVGHWRQEHIGVGPD